MSYDGYIALARKVAGVPDGGASGNGGGGAPPARPFEIAGGECPERGAYKNANNGRESLEPKSNRIPKLFIAKCPNRRYSGDYCGHWFESGEALVTATEAFALELKGCQICTCGDEDDD